MKRKSGPVRRILFRWQDEKLAIIDERRIPEMTIPNTKSLPKTDKEQQVSGFWFDVLDSKGRVVYRQTIIDPLRRSLEVPNPDGSFTIIPDARKEGVFEVIIPDSPENVTLSILRTEERPKERKTVLRKIAQIDLKMDYRSKLEEPEKRREE